MSDTPYTTRSTCRVCGSPGLTPLFSLGEQMVSDFVEKDRVHSGVRCPIDLALCPECTCCQLLHTADPEVLYRRHYWFRSSVTRTIRDALADVARSAESLVYLEPGDVVADLGANDGTGLRSFARQGLYKVAVEPADNLAAECGLASTVLIREFWGTKACADAWDFTVGRKAKVVTACGMLYDSDDPNAFVAEVARVLHPDGVFIAQLMCARQMLLANDVGNLAHEHLLFPTLRSLECLFGAHGLRITHAEENGVNGGSYRLFVRRQGHSRPGDSVGHFRAQEAAAGLGEPQAYLDFFARARANRDRCVEFLRREYVLGRRIAVLGASTKGNVLLQWYGLDSSLVSFASERSREKVGKFTVGTGIKIVSEEEARGANPSYFLVLPYSFRDEIVRRERAFLEAGGKLVFPLPSFEVVGKEELYV